MFCAYERNFNLWIVGNLCTFSPQDALLIFYFVPMDAISTFGSKLHPGEKAKPRLGSCLALHDVNPKVSAILLTEIVIRLSRMHGI